MQPNQIMVGGVEHQLIAISSPIFNKDPSAEIDINIAGKYLKLANYYKTEFNEDKLIRDISNYIKRQDVVLIGNIRIDRTRIKPNRHIHLINIDLANDTSPYSTIVEKKQSIQQTYNLSDKEWDKYWDDLCHMNINYFALPSDVL
jgi:hypothetical protein